MISLVDIDYQAVGQRPGAPTVRAFNPTARRIEFRQKMKTVASKMEDTALVSVLFSTAQVSSATDGAIVTFKSSGSALSFVFLFEDGEWKSIPDTFR
jgi:hypothetical protein